MKDQPKNDDYLWNRSGDDVEVAELERLLSPLAHNAPLKQAKVSRRRWIGVAVFVTALAAAVFIAVVPAEPAASGPGFAYTLGTARGELAVGAWLETPGDREADITIANIGRVTLGEASRLRLVATGPNEHRLELARGHLSAVVTAPPRLFVVDTPVASAVDLGCAYDVSVEESGATHLVVTSGAVSLEGASGIAWVPAGHEVRAWPARGPGVPTPLDAPPAFTAAVAGFERAASPTERAQRLQSIVETADQTTIATLWNLVARTAGTERREVAHTLAQFVPAPRSMDFERLQGRQLDAWQADVSAVLLRR